MMFFFITKEGFRMSIGLGINQSFQYILFNIAWFAITPLNKWVPNRHFLPLVFQILRNLRIYKSLLH